MGKRPLLTKIRLGNLRQQLSRLMGVYEMDEFIQEFLIEGSELLDQLDRDFVELEKHPDSKELVAESFAPFTP